MRAQAQLRIGPRCRCDTHRQAAPATPPGNSPLLPTGAGFRPQPSPRVSPARACRRARRAEAVITGTVYVITPSEPSWIPPCVRPSRRQFGKPVIALRHESTDAARRGRPWSLPLEGRAAPPPGTPTWRRVDSPRRSGFPGRRPLLARRSGRPTAAREPHPTARRGRNTTPRPPPATSPLPDEGEGHTAALHARRDTKILYGTALWCGRQRTHPTGTISLGGVLTRRPPFPAVP